MLQKTLPPNGNVIYLICKMRLSSTAVDTRLRSYVYLLAADFEPDSAATPERIRLFYFGQAKEAAIELPSFPFGSLRNRDLRMVNADDTHF